MKQPSYLKDTCDTVRDVLEHPFFYHSLISFIKQQKIWGKRASMLSYTSSFDTVEPFIFELFSSENLYEVWLKTVRKKYSRLSKGTFNIKQIFAGLTTLSYIRDTLDTLPLSSLSDTVSNRLIDILDYDTALGDESLQIPRRKLLLEGYPLIDDRGYEIENPLSEYELGKYIQIVRARSRDIPFFVAKPEPENDIENDVDDVLSYYILTLDGAYICDRGKIPLTLGMLNKVIIAGGHIYFQKSDDHYIFDETGKAFKDDDGNNIDDIFIIQELGDTEYALVASSVVEIPYWVNVKTHKVLRAIFPGAGSIGPITHISGESARYKGKTYYCVGQYGHPLRIDEDGLLLLGDFGTTAFLVHGGIAYSTNPHVEPELSYSEDAMDKKQKDAKK